MSKKMIAELKEGELVDSLFSVKYKRAVDAYKNGFKFSFGAADSSGEVETSFWGGSNKTAVQAVHDSFLEGDVVRVRGVAGTWKEKIKIDVNEGKGSIQKAHPNEYDLADFIPKSKKNIDKMFEELLALVRQVKHEGLQKTLNAFFDDKKFAEEFKQAPGAMYIHHAWLGGLLEHTLATANTALAAAKEYPEADRDYIIAGALLHDVGKMKELATTTNIKVSEEGMLRGHTVIGEEMVRERAKRAGLDEHALMKLSHIILSHHGAQENGSPKKPMFVEAILVYYADEMDSKASQFARIKAETNTEDFRTYEKHLGEIYLR